MGSNISVVNKTKHNVHVCLKQVSPLYFENNLRPGGAFTRDVGKVWFTIEVRMSLGKNEYSTGKSVLKGALFSGTTILSLLNPGLLVVGAAGAIGGIAASNDGGVIWSPGWYLGYDRCVEIRSKVVSQFQAGDAGGGISEKRVGEGGILQFYLVEVCPGGCGRENKGKCAHC